jgi:hypothetical protein
MQFTLLFVSHVLCCCLQVYLLREGLGVCRLQVMMQLTSVYMHCCVQVCPWWLTSWSCQPSQYSHYSAAHALLHSGVSLVANGLGVSRHEVLHAAAGDRAAHRHHADATLQHEVWEQQPVLVEVPVDVRCGW